MFVLFPLVPFAPLVGVLKCIIRIIVIAQSPWIYGNVNKRPRAYALGLGLFTAINPWQLCNNYYVSARKKCLNYRRNHYSQEWSQKWYQQLLLISIVAVLLVTLRFHFKYWHPISRRYLSEFSNRPQLHMVWLLQTTLLWPMHLQFRNWLAPWFRVMFTWQLVEVHVWD